MRKKGVFASIAAIVSVMVIGFALFFLVVKEENLSKDVALKAATSEEADEYAHIQPPSLEEVPEGEEGELIKLGYSYVNDTANTLDGHVGNTLSCSSCHANGGVGGSLDFVGVTKTYPMYNP